MDLRDKADIYGVTLFFVAFVAFLLCTPRELVLVVAPSGDAAYLLGLVMFFVGIPTCRHLMRWMLGVTE